MAKKVMTMIKLQIPAGAANPAPPVGTALGQHGVNIMEFCKAYNEQTKAQTGTHHPGRDHRSSRTARSRSSPRRRRRPMLLREAAGIDKGSAKPTCSKVGSVTPKQIREIAEIKLPDLNTTTSRTRCASSRAPRARWGSRSE